MPVPTPSITVEQGPNWLANLLYNPPGWVVPSVAIIMFGVLGLAVYGYRQSGGVDDAVRREMVETVWVVLCITTAAYTLTTALTAPYIVDVVGGTALGYVVALGSLRVASRRL